MKLLSKRIDRIQRLIAPLINVGGSKHVQDEVVFGHLKAAQAQLDVAFLSAENPVPPLFEKADWECSDPGCDYVAEQAEGAPHRCPKCLSTKFNKANVIGGPDDPNEEDSNDDDDDDEEA